MTVKTKVVGWVKTSGVQVEQQSAARERWEPPHQGRTTPGPRSRSADGHQTLLFPHALPFNSINCLLFFSIWGLPAFALLLIHTMPSPSRATCIQCIHSVRPSSDGSYLLSSYPLAPKHFGFSSVVAFIMTSLFWLYIVFLSLTYIKLKHYLNSPPPSVSVSVSPLWQVQCRTRGRCLLIFCVKLTWLYWTTLLLNGFTYNKHYQGLAMTYYLWNVRRCLYTQLAGLGFVCFLTKYEEQQFQKGQAIVSWFWFLITITHCFF